MHVSLDVLTYTPYINEDDDYVIYNTSDAYWGFAATRISKCEWSPMI